MIALIWVKFAKIYIDGISPPINSRSLSNMENCVAYSYASQRTVRSISYVNNRVQRQTIGRHPDST